MLHPVGSLPPTVYWKRRVAGIAVLVLLLLVAVFVVTSRTSSSAAGNSGQTLTGSTQTPQLNLIPAQPLQTTSAPPTSPAAVSGADPGAATPTVSAPAVSTPAVTTPAVTTAPAATTPAGPVPCTDQMLALTAAPQQPDYATTDKPTFILTVTNTSTQACTRDVGGIRAQFQLYSADTRLWGSNDCYPGSGDDVRTLAPAESVQLTVVWSGTSSEPTCTAERTRLAPGTYILRANLETATSPDGAVTLH